MSVSLARARDIIRQRSRVSITTPPAQIRTNATFICRWDAHCREVSLSRCYGESYRETLTNFCEYQRGFLDKPDTPLIGCGKTDSLYLTALEIRLRGRFIPETEQSPTTLDPEWDDICHAYMEKVLWLTGDEEWYHQHATLHDAIFLHQKDAIFPRTWVDAFSKFIGNLTAFVQSESVYDEPPFTQEFRIFLRTLFSAVSYF